jgi:microsomal dipeptidase-like Zn-dependent dipeptidase
VYRTVGRSSVCAVDPTSMVLGLENVSRYPYLFAELLRRAYSHEELMKIAGRSHCEPCAKWSRCRRACRKQKRR